ncbi:MAG: hypothetical protein JXX29_01635 [Deltaproteobacteria bacterium]|nr:hypothetical protein [Deltaproteobacteria bacterium]MBN2670341.1 hypothetical protein [Deltaproteobacteria bacterium]
MNYFLRMGWIATQVALVPIWVIAQDAPVAPTDTYSPVTADTENTQADVQAAAPTEGTAATQTVATTVAPDEEKQPLSECMPACRAGFLCHRGMCVSACNPPCSSGFVCTAAAQCVADTNGPPPPSSVATAQYADQMARREQARKERLELRMKYRKAPRFMLATVLGIGGIGDDLDMMAYMTPSLGFKMNFIDTVGFQIRAGGMLGLVDLGLSSTDSYGDEDTSEPIGFGGFYAEGGVFFGPFGRFYIGPIGWFSYTKPFDEYITFDGFRYGAPDEIDGPLGGGGLDMGIRVGKREQIDIHWRIRSTFTTSMPFALEGGVAFHFMQD